MSDATEPTVLDEVLCKSLTILDDEGRRRIRLYVSGADQCASVALCDDGGDGIVSLNAGDATLGVVVDDGGHRACDITAAGLEVSVTGGGDVQQHIDELLDRVRKIADQLDDLRAERDRLS